MDVDVVIVTMLWQGTAKRLYSSGFSLLAPKAGDHESKASCRHHHAQSALRTAAGPAGRLASGGAEQFTQSVSQGMHNS